MNTDREYQHGEYWADEGIYIRFNMKKLWAWLVSLFLLSGICYGQTYQIEYSGIDKSANLVAKTTASNMCTYSEQIDNAAWTKTGVTITANSVTAPDGTLTADTMTNTAVSSSHIVYSAAITVVSGSTYRYSGYIKYATHPYVIFRSQAPATSYLNIDLSTGTIVSVGSTTLSYGIRPVGNGWYYVYFTSVKNAGVSDYVTFNLTNSSYTQGSYLGAITESAYFWGASYQLASAPADYIVTTSAAATFGPQCGVGFTQSFLDPTRCIAVSDTRFRRW